MPFGAAPRNGELREKVFKLRATVIGRKKAHEAQK
jgi:hypothetical protein